MKIDFGTHYNLKKYYNLDEGIEEVCPELKQKNEIIRMLCERLYWARKNLEEAVEELVEDEDE